MSKLVIKKNNIFRRHNKTDDINLCSWIIIRSCNQCSSEGLSCVISDISNFCERYYRFYRYYDLNPFFQKIAKLYRKAEKLDEQILAETRKSFEVETRRSRL